MPQSDPAKMLQIAARLYGARISPGEVVTRVEVFGSHGKIASLKVPPPVAASPPPDGWDFSRAVPHHNGKPIEIHGIRAGLLRVLAEAEGPLTLAAIRSRWETQAEDGTIRWHLARLRTSLSRYFKPPTVEYTPSGYVLRVR